MNKAQTVLSVLLLGASGQTWGAQEESTVTPPSQSISSPRMGRKLIRTIKPLSFRAKEGQLYADFGAYKCEEWAKKCSLASVFDNLKLGAIYAIHDSIDTLIAAQGSFATDCGRRWGRDGYNISGALLGRYYGLEDTMWGGRGFLNLASRAGWRTQMGAGVEGLMTFEYIVVSGSVDLHLWQDPLSWLFGKTPLSLKATDLDTLNDDSSALREYMKNGNETLRIAKFLRLNLQLLCPKFPQLMGFTDTVFSLSKGRLIENVNTPVHTTDTGTAEERGGSHTLGLKLMLVPALTIEIGGTLNPVEMLKSSKPSTWIEHGSIRFKWALRKNMPLKAQFSPSKVKIVQTQAGRRLDFTEYKTDLRFILSL